MLGWLWLAAAAGLIVIYRGLTQSLTIDEAYTYHLFLNQKASVLFQKYDAAYHVLHTWMSWLAVHRFGKSEAVIRLPSMVAGLFYLFGVGVLTRRLVGYGWRFLAGVVLLSANPLLADYLSAARGYGAALAFFIWAFAALLSDRVVQASILLALSVTCSLTFIVPAFAASGVYLMYQARSGIAVAPLLRRLAVPFFLVAAPVLAVPLWHASSSHFYYGASDLGTSLDTLIAPSLAHADPYHPRWVVILERFAFPLLAIAMILTGVKALKLRAFPVVLAVGSLAGSFVILIAARLVGGVLYPWGRTGLYLIWLFVVSCLVLWDWTAHEHGWIKRLSLAFAAVSVLLAARFVVQLDTRYYFEFRDDAQVNVMLRRLRDLHPTGPACIGGSWAFEPTVNYYRLRYKLAWLEEMKRTPEPQAGCEFYILNSNDQRYVDEFDLRPLWTDPISGTILAQVSK